MWGWWRCLPLHHRVLVSGLAGLGVLVPGLAAWLPFAALMWLVPLGAALVAAMVGFTYAMVVHPLRRVESALRRLAEGDLAEAADLETADTGEVGRIMQAVATVRGELRQEFRREKDQAGRLSHSCQDLSENASQASQAVEHQTEQAADIARSAQEVNDQAQSVASDVAAVSESATEASNTAENGMETLAQASGRVKEMVSASGEVSEVAATIEDIAGKTDLLALNAAIEAANAGEAGQGFAVVADEVRKLAEQTSQATGRITSTLDRLQEETRGSSETMEQVLGDMTGILGMIERTDSLAGRIASSAEDMAATLSGVTDRIGEVAESSQTVKHSVARIRETAQEMQDMAGEMRDSASRYQL
jgi:methyl-accepting chemotaxis protein